MNKPISKGPDLEERLRHYFIGLNCYVLRGVKYKYNNFELTDIDLWVYSKNSALFRERTNVDIKNKKTPQALERIFWAKGLQNVLGLDHCVVATTDSRPDVREYGSLNAVTVLDGNFISRLEKSDKSHLNRLNEETLLEEFDRTSLGKLGGDWKGRYEISKSRLLTELNFDGCNGCIKDIQFFIEAIAAYPEKKNCALRAMYACFSHLIIAIDFITKDYATLEPQQRYKILVEGFRYGCAGKSITERVSNISSLLARSVGVSESLFSDELEFQMKMLNVEILADFFSKHGVQQLLFEIAIEFEAAAFGVELITANDLSSNCKGALGALCDFIQIDRRIVI
nr:hypothetical protein [uncultured Deefgea sp.]